MNYPVWFQGKIVAYNKNTRFFVTFKPQENWFEKQDWTPS